MQKESVRQTNSGPVVTVAPLCHKLCYLFHLPSFSSPASSCPNMGASFCPAANQHSGLHPSWRWHGLGPGRRLQWGESNRLAGNKWHRQTHRTDRRGKDREKGRKWLEVGEQRRKDWKWMWERTISEEASPGLSCGAAAGVSLWPWNRWRRSRGWELR